MRGAGGLEAASPAARAFGEIQQQRKKPKPDIGSGRLGFMRRRRVRL